MPNAAEAATVVADYSGELFTLGGIALVAVLGWVGTIIAKRLREPTRIETLWLRLDSQDAKIHAQDERMGELNTRIDTAERRAGASGRIIRDLARQWPSTTVPRLNPVDIDELDEDTVPAHWRVKTP